MKAAFTTDEGIEVHAVTADQMRDVDPITIHETGRNLLQMMEDAGSNLARHTIQLLGAGGVPASWCWLQGVVMAGVALAT